MRFSFVRSALAAAFVAGAALSLSTGAMAADKGQSVSKSLATPLKAAQDAMKANDFAGALAHVKEAQAVPGLTDYDNFVINQFLGNIYIGMKDYKNAETAFVAMASSPDLPQADKANAYSTTIQLAVNNNDWATAIKFGEQLQAIAPLQGPLVEQLAVAYYNSGDKAKALAIAKPQIDADKAAGRPSSEALMQIQLGAQATSNDTAGAMATIEGMVAQHGNPDDWARLIDLTFGSKGLTDIQALNLYRLRIITGATTSVDDYVIMGQVASINLLYPVEGEMMIEHGVSTGVVKPGDKASAALAQIRPKAAKDKASIGEFEKLAIARKTGDYDLKLAETYYGYGRYADAETAVRRAMGKGGVKDNAEAQMVLGMALAQQGKNADAAAAFAKVSGNANEMKIAHLWTVYAQRQYGAPASHS
jgi:tetratricopeptide (TPR) repeat protein